MDRYKVKWTRLQSEIFRFLCIKAGQTFNGRGIAHSLKVSPTAVTQALRDVEKEQVIKVKRPGAINLLSIELNRDNPRAVHLKRVENIKMVYESGLADFLYSQFPGCTLILFGSYSRGEDVYFGEKDGRNSDIDIAIIGTKGKEKDLHQFEKMLERVISTNYYTSWKDIHKNLKENILNGIVLSGGVEL